MTDEKKPKSLFEGLTDTRFEQVDEESRKKREEGLGKFQEEMSKANRHNRGGLIPTAPPGVMPVPHEERIRYNEIKALWNAIDGIKDVLETQNQALSELTDLVRNIVRERAEK